MDVLRRATYANGGWSASEDGEVVQAIGRSCQLGVAWEREELDGDTEQRRVYLFRGRGRAGGYSDGISHGKAGDDGQDLGAHCDMRCSMVVLVPTRLYTQISVANMNSKNLGWMSNHRQQICATKSSGRLSSLVECFLNLNVQVIISLINRL